MRKRTQSREQAQQPEIHSDLTLHKGLNTFLLGHGIGIKLGNDHTLNAALDNPANTGRGTTVMCTGFEGIV